MINKSYLFLKYLVTVKTHPAVVNSLLMQSNLLLPALYQNYQHRQSTPNISTAIGFEIQGWG